MFLYTVKYLDQENSNIIALQKMHIRKWEIIMSYEAINVIKNIFRRACYDFIVFNLSMELSIATCIPQKCYNTIIWKTYQNV